MASSVQKSLNALDRITELSNNVGKALENYITARTAIRDYLISVDEKYYAEVEQRVAAAIEELTLAEALADQDETRGTIQEIRDSIYGWSLLALQVRDAFAGYHHAVESKVVAYFDTLVHRGSVILQSNASLAPAVILDVQTANAAITGYLLKSDERFAENAQRAISWAKEKIEQMAQTDGQVSPALQSFATNLDACAEGLREAVAYRKNAQQLFRDNLAPFGVRIQAEFEQFRQQIIESQRKARS
jgi:CHASE3 domain sensor protein